MRSLNVLILASVLFIAVSASAALNNPVKLDSGWISGVPGTIAGVTIFKGIPYAAPPVGDLRWRPPQPPAAWEGIRKADHFGSICVQPPYAAGSFYQLEFFQTPQPAMSEDCLYLNVWTAANSPAEGRPVMVWIHGGGNVQGYSSEPCFDGDALARKGVVLVSINYRLGIFGLFAHPELSRESEHHVSGNYAELDQIAALQWVQRNIGAFGGDAKNVTIFGQSSGGGSINRLLVCPLARGLFAKVILESAAVWNSRDSRTHLADMEARGAAFVKAVGVSSIKELRAMPTADVLAASQKMKFDPNIDGWILPELAADTFDRGGQYAVPMLIGSNADEGPYSPVTSQTFVSDSRLRYGTDADEFLKLYPAGTDAQAVQSKHDARRDESFAGERAEARDQARVGAPVYLYYFDRRPPGHDRGKYGAFHCAEIEYVFNSQSATTRPWEPVDRNLADLMISYWTNFAATGNPNRAGQPQWPAYDPAGDKWLEIGDTVAARTVPDRARLDFMERFLHKDAR